MNKQMDRITYWLMALFFTVGAMSTCRMGTAQTPSLPPNRVVVNMIQLLSHPEKYEGKWVLTRGFLSMQPEREYHLYLHEEDSKYALGNGMVLILTEAQHKQFEKLNLKYVLIEGKVHAAVSNHNEGFSGEMADIVRMELWGTWNKIPPKH